MKDYMDAVKAAGIGRTPQLCQDALIEMLEELFAGKKYNGQQGRKPLNIYKQDLPVPEDYDADVDTDAAAAPYIVARMTGGAIKDESGPADGGVQLDRMRIRRGRSARGLSGCGEHQRGHCAAGLYEALFRRCVHHPETRRMGYAAG